MKEGYWVIRTYLSGRVGEKTKFWVQGVRPDRRSRRKERMEIKKQIQNEYATAKTVARLFNANYCKGDVLGSLDYSPAALKKLEQYIGSESEQTDRDMQIWLAADKRFKLVMDSARRECAKRGIELKCVGVTSDMDGDTGEHVRVHHHLVVNAEAWEIIKEKWKKWGGTNGEPLSDQADYTPVAEYMMRQVRHDIPNKKRYFSTRNLVRPQPKDAKARSGAELSVPRGCELLFRNAFKPGQAQYIRYLVPEEAEGTEKYRRSRGGGRL